MNRLTKARIRPALWMGVILCVMIMCFAGASSHAQDENKKTAPPKDPIEISADQALEWNQENKQYTADGNVVVTQGTMTLYADRLIADYRDDGTGKASNNIWQITALSDDGKQVKIDDTGRILLATKAVYDLEKNLITATGESLKLSTPDMIVTANERMTYQTVKNIATATGKARLVKGVERINAQTLTAYLKKDAQGKLALSSATANGDVVIQTATETLTGKKGIYDLANNQALIEGDVTITRGPNKLEGQKATLDLITKVSKMFSVPGTHSKNGDGRVRGVFYPGTFDANEGETPKEGGQNAP